MLNPAELNHIAKTLKAISSGLTDLLNDPDTSEPIKGFLFCATRNASIAGENIEDALDSMKKGPVRDNPP